MLPLPVAGAEVSWPLVVLLGLIVGVVAGFFGVGGGFLLTPLLNALFGVPYSVAVGSSLSQMIGLSSAASIRHGGLGHIDYRLGFLMLAGAATGTELGAQVMESLKGSGTTVIAGAEMPTVTLVMSATYATLLTWIGWSVGRESINAARRARDGHEEPPNRLARLVRGMRLKPMVSLPASGIESISLWILIGVGLLAGFVSGLLGVGGGFILMPVLIYMIGCPTLVAVGTSLFQTVFTAAYGTFTHSLKGNVDPLLVVFILVGSSIGAQVGASLTGRFDASRVRIGFAALAFVGVAIVVGKLVMTVASGGA